MDSSEVDLSPIPSSLSTCKEKQHRSAEGSTYCCLSVLRVLHRVIVDVLVDEEGNLVVDEEGQYVTMRTSAVNTTTEVPTTARTPIPLTVPPAQMSDPFNPFTGNFG